MTPIPTFRHLLFLITALAFSITACQKAKDGEVGPQGATGAAGAAGPQGTPGAAGPAGPKGDPGTANVTYSAWFSVTSWQQRTSYNNVNQIYNDHAVAAITDATINQGALMVYARLNGYASSFDLSNKVVQLPFVVPYSATTGENDFWAFRATTGSLRITFENSRNTYVASGIATSHQFRYVIIPGGVAGGRKAAVDMNDYAAVKAYYHIPD